MCCYLEKHAFFAAEWNFDGFLKARQSVYVCSKSRDRPLLLLPVYIICISRTGQARPHSRTCPTCLSSGAELRNVATFIVQYKNREPGH